VALAVSGLDAGSKGGEVRAMPRETDIHIGRQLREARLARGLSQGALGKKLGVTFQQVQKYESGANRIGGSRLPLTRRSLELAKEIDAIEDETVKLQILRLVRAIAKATPD
jgi:transcriptional regulator with XRE-family HTH domain